jgi:hypothetical protein
MLGCASLGRDEYGTSHVRPCANGDVQVRYELLLDTCGMQLEALAGEIEMIRDEVLPPPR